MADTYQQTNLGLSIERTSRIKKYTKPNITKIQHEMKTQKNRKPKLDPETGTKKANTEAIRNQEITNPATLKKQSMFLPTSRLNRGQRKYCHCLMSVRTPKQSPYGICASQSYRTMKANPGKSAFRFIPRKTNCIMNYDYTQYTLEDVQNLAVERGIPLTNPLTGAQNNKTSLVQLLTKRYINKHRIQKPKPE